MSSDAPPRLGATRPTSHVLRGAAADHAQLARFTFEPVHNRRSTDRLPPMEQQLATARSQGWEAGYQAGLKAARAEAETRSAEAAQRAADVLRQFAARAAVDGSRAVSVTTRDATELAFELTRTLVGHELAASTSPGLGAVSRALQLASPGQELTVRLHPDEMIGVDVLQPLVPECRLVVLPDPDIESGGCVVDAGSCRIDAQIQPALERVRSVLFSDLPVGDPTGDPMGDSAGDPMGDRAGDPMGDPSGDRRTGR